MLNTSIEIIVIKNKNTNPNNGGDCILSADFTVPIVTTTTTVFATNTTSTSTKSYVSKNVEDFKKQYLAGDDAIFSFRFANKIEINHSYKDLTKTCRIVIPRALNKAFKASNLVNFDGQSIPLFGRGDRIIVRTGYNNVFNETFRGYITTIGSDVPTVLDCEDMMFFLKTMEFRFSPTDGKKQSSTDRSGLMSGNNKDKITLKNLIKCALSKNYNNKIGIGQDVFDFPTEPFSPTQVDYQSSGTPIKVYFDLEVNTNPFTYTTGGDMSIAEFLLDLKKKFPMVVIYFDDWINLRIGLLYTKDSKTFVNDTPVTFYFEKMIIDGRDMKMQLASETNIKIIMKSPRKNKKLPPLIASDVSDANKGYYGSAVGDIIRVEAVSDLTQEKLNADAKILYESQKYDGFKKGSSFETFGTPVVHIGNKIKLVSELYPEKNGTYMCHGLKTTMGMGGYRQIVSIGVKLLE